MLLSGPTAKRIDDNGFQSKPLILMRTCHQSIEESLTESPSTCINCSFTQFSDLVARSKEFSL